MNLLEVKPLFNLFIFKKYNLGLWKISFFKKTWYPKFSGSSWKSHSKYGIKWMNYLLELSWNKTYEKDCKASTKCRD